MKTKTGVRITTARFKNFSIYRPSCMNAYKNSILEYGWLSLLFQAGGRARRWKSRGMLPILDLRLEYLIDDVLLAHVCASMVANRGYAFRETLLVDDAERVRSFVPFFSKRSWRIVFFQARRAQRDHLMISDEIGKGWARHVTQNTLLFRLSFIEKLKFANRL